MTNFRPALLVLTFVIYNITIEGGKNMNTRKIETGVAVVKSTVIKRLKT